MFGERAQASSQMAKRAVLISKICMVSDQFCDVEEGFGTYYLAAELLTQRSCDEGTNLYQVLEGGSFALFRGGLLTTYPKMKNETVNVDNVVESLSNSAFIKDVAGAKMDDANGLLYLSTGIVH